MPEVSQPEFKGGMTELKNYLERNIVMPKVEMDSIPERRKVFVKFLVNNDGSIQNVGILKSSGDSLLDKEAIRVVSVMPNWIPAKSSGKEISMAMNLPIIFKSK